jgi:hypothetical protein
VIPTKGNKIPIFIARFAFLVIVLRLPKSDFAVRESLFGLHLYGKIIVLTAGRIGIFLLQSEHIERKINKED